MGSGRTLADESADAFGDLLSAHRRELLVHRYRMRGTIDEPPAFESVDIGPGKAQDLSLS
jgi:hypothetical protein